MKKAVKKILALVAFMFVSGFASAQEQVECSLSADVISHYIWRGMDMGGFSVQPAASISWQGLSLGFEGSRGFSEDDVQEIDLKLGVQRWGVNIGVTDYWMSGIDKNDRYLYFDEMEGAHKLEANLGYTCDYFSLQAYTYFWGKDQKINGKRAYSTYIELAVPFRLGGLDWLAKGGMTPFESAGYTEPMGEEGIEATLLKANYDYAEGAACVEASLRATKTLDIGFSKLPIFAEFNVNPYLQTANIIFGLTLTAF